MKSLNSTLLAFFFMVFIGALLSWSGCKPAIVQGPMDLAWKSERPEIVPAPFDTVEIDFGGVKDTVYVISDDSVLVSIAKDLGNSGPESLLQSSNYEVRLVIESYTLSLVIGGSASFNVRDTILDTTYVGPTPLDSGQTVNFLAGIGIDLDCGLHRFEITIDDARILGTETSTSNNVFEDFIFVQSFEIFNISLANGRTVGTISNPVLQPSINTYNVTPGAPGVTDAFVVGWKVMPPSGSQLAIDPPKGANVGLPGNVDIDLAVDPSAGPFERKLGKITMISADGCILKQKTAIVEIEHIGP